MKLLPELTKDLETEKKEEQPIEPRSRRILKKKTRLEKILIKLYLEMSFKTFFISQIVLLLISVLFLGGIYFILNQDSGKLDLGKYSPVTKPPQSFNLTIGYPDDESVVTQKDITLTGVSAPSAVIILNVNSAKDESTIGFEADSKGNFSRVLSLSPGLNQITINSVDRAGNNKSTTRSIYYSEENL